MPAAAQALKAAKNALSQFKQPVQALEALRAKKAIVMEKKGSGVGGLASKKDACPSAFHWHAGLQSEWVG